MAHHGTEVIVEHDYTATDDQELTLKRGDIIKSVEQRPDGWWSGELKGRVGLFPDNFVRFLGPRDGNDAATRNSLPQYCRAVFSYNQANPDELNLSVGDVITVLGEVEEGWWKGQKGMQLGVFPSNFVTPLVEPTPPLPPRIPAREQCKVLYPYTAANADELTLVEGDILTIVSKDVPDQGWWRGELRGRIGLFPDNFVVILAHQIDDDPHKKPARPAKNVSTLGSLKNSTVTSVKKDSKPNVQENIAAVRKSLELNDPNAELKKKKMSDSLENIVDAGSNKLRKSHENEDKKSRKSLEPDGGNKPPVPKKAGSPVVAMLSELRQKVLSSDNRSSQSADSADGLSGSKISGEPVLKSVSPTPSLPPSISSSPATSDKMSESFDHVERSSMLNDPRSGRAKGPLRRPPSQAIRDDVVVTNGSSHNSSTESTGDIEIKPKAREWEKQKAPWMEELKFNQAKKVSPISEIGRSKTISAPDSEKTEIPLPRLSGSSDKILEAGESESIKDMPLINPLEMSQSMSSLSSKNVKIETTLEAHNTSENPLDMSKSLSSMSSRSTHLESNNKVSPSELRTSISSSASVIMRSTTHIPGNALITNNSSKNSSPAHEPVKAPKSTNESHEEDKSNNPGLVMNGLPSGLTPDQMLIAHLNERIANLERVVESQEARFTAALESLGAQLSREIELRKNLQAEVQKLERCVTRV